MAWRMSKRLELLVNRRVQRTSILAFSCAVATPKQLSVFVKSKFIILSALNHALLPLKIV